MRPRRIAAVAVAIAVGAAVSSAPANAQGGLDAFPRSVLKQLPIVNAEGTNGYAIKVIAATDEVYLVASQPRWWSVSYLTEDARVRQLGRRIRADFGDAGSLALRFHPRSPPRPHTIPGCEGAYEVRHGVWKGEFQFVGENGFTSASVTRAPGRLPTPGDLDCTEDDGEEDGGGGSGVTGHGITLEAQTRDARERGGTVFETTWQNGRARAAVGASVVEVRGPVTVSFDARRFAPRTLAHVSSRRGRARVSPGPPFFGSAKFRQGNQDIDVTGPVPVGGAGPKWEGDLGVTLPAVGTVALTGPKFSAALIPTTFISIRHRAGPFAALRSPLADILPN